MLVSVNGETLELPEGATVQSVVATLRSAPDARGVAVAVGGEVVPRAAWPSTALSSGAQIEVVVAVQGG